MFDNFCSLFSNNAQPGQYAFQAFKKVPALNNFIQAINMLSQLSGVGQGGLINNIGNINNVINTAGNIFGINNNPNSNIGNIMGVINQFINNVPQESVKANDSNLDKIIAQNQDSVIKQILKSNYVQLINKHNQSK